MNEQFKRDFAKLLSKAGKNAEKVVRKVALDLQTSVAYKTPVDDGRLRGNWQLSVGEPASGELGKEGANQSGLVNSTLAKGRTQANAYQSGQTIWIVNNLPYAAVVEYGQFGKPPGSANGPKTAGGFSTQAPKGMRDLTVQEFKDFVSDQVRKL